MGSNIPKTALALAALGLSLLGGVIDTAKNTTLINTPIERDNWHERGVGQNEITDRQLEWIHDLEYCESGGKGIYAINPQDRDGTPSYFHFQWKPRTFYYYAVKKYKILSDGLEMADYMNFMSDYDLQFEVITRMIGDKSVVWQNEFPVCVKKLGLPPKD